MSSFRNFSNRTMYNQFFLYESPSRKPDHGDTLKLGKDINFQLSKQISDQCIPLPTILDQGLKKTSIAIQEKSKETEKIESLDTVQLSDVKIQDKPEIKELNKSFEVNM